MSIGLIQQDHVPLVLLFNDESILIKSSVPSNVKNNVLVTGFAIAVFGRRGVNTNANTDDKNDLRLISNPLYKVEQATG